MDDTKKDLLIWAASRKKKIIRTFQRLFTSVGVDILHLYEDSTSLQKDLENQFENRVHLFLHFEDLGILNFFDFQQPDIESQKDEYIQFTLQVLDEIAKKFPHLKIHLTSNDLDYLFVVKYFSPLIENIFCINSPFYQMILRNHLDHIIGGETFNLENLLGHGTDIKESVLKQSNQIDSVVFDFSQYLHQLNASRDIRERSCFVFEELLSNALYGAPVDEDGNFKYRKFDRKVNIALLENEYVDFNYGCNGDTLAIIVKDRFGTLDRDKITHYIKKMASIGTLSQEKTSSGGGLGFFYILRNCHSLTIHIKEGQFCYFIAFFAAQSRGARDRVDNLNFNFYFE